MSYLVPRRFQEVTRAGSGFFDDDFFRPFFFGNEFTSSAFRVDVRDESENYVIYAELPGFRREDIHIDVEDGMLTVSAEWNDEPEGGYIVNERRAGHAQRSFALDNVDEDGITADYSDGLLRITMPKRERQRRVSRRIELN